MGVLKKTNMKEQIYDLIKERILNQTYALGEKINMLELAQELEVSNSPIREALSLLESERLVTFTPNAGPSVTKITPKIFDEIQETTKIMLIGSYEQCVQKNLIPKLIPVMEECLREQRQFIESPCPGTDYEFAKLSIEFDVSLIKIFGNATLENLYSAFFNLFFLVVLYDHQNYDIDRKANIDEHAIILQEIKAGNHDNVKKYINLHFSRSVDFN